jgi:hypothetical protein
VPRVQGVAVVHQHAKQGVRPPRTPPVRHERPQVQRRVEVHPLQGMPCIECGKLGSCSTDGLLVVGLGVS